MKWKNQKQSSNILFHNMLNGTPRFFTLSFFLFLLYQVSFGQSIIQGSITDGYTGEALPFANVVYQPEQRLGATADLNGRFKILIQAPVQRLRITYIGYQTIWISADSVDF